MTERERETLRRAIDRAVRARVDAVRVELDGRGFCLECQMEVADWTPGCRACSDRHRSLHRRGTHPLGESGYLAQRAEVRRRVIAEQSRVNTEAWRGIQIGTKGARPRPLWSGLARPALP